MELDPIAKSMLEKIADLHSVPEGAFNLRLNGKGFARKSSANIEIAPKKDKPGIDIIIKPGTKNESVHIPVVLSETGLRDLVYNDFYVGEDCDVVIVAGCGIHNAGSSDSSHNGIHSFHLAKNAKVKYIEKHYGEGNGDGKRILNPVTRFDLEENAFLEMETTQIKGVDSTERTTEGVLNNGAKTVITEKIMTHGSQFAKTSFKVELNGENSSANVVSRSVARDSSRQEFVADIRGNTRCYGHSECDAIIMDDAVVTAVPKIEANCLDARLVHEAAIGKIAGDQLDKLMTLGLTEKEAEERIISGFLK